jgi:hypothetical protein
MAPQATRPAVRRVQLLVCHLGIGYVHTYADLGGGLDGYVYRISMIDGGFEA